MNPRSRLTNAVRQTAKRTKWALVAYTMVHSSIVRAKLRAHIFSSQTGCLGLPVNKRVAYIHQQFSDYMHYGNLTPEKLKGLTVLEGGPGDNLGVALSFIAAGASKVVGMDLFDSRSDPEHERESYLALRSGLDTEGRARFDEAVDLSSGVSFNPARLQAIYGRGLEEVGDVFAPSTFDLIVTRGVLQEIYDGNRLLSGMHTALRTGGRMLHKIDLRDYGLFSANGHNPLTFLTIPSNIYKVMARHSDRPVPRLTDWYRKKLADLGFDAELYRTAIVRSRYSNPPVELSSYKLKLDPETDYAEDTLRIIQEIRPKLQPRFKTLSDEDLVTCGLFMVASKV